MSSYLLVHGAWHGAWCWEQVVSRLRRRGHEVRAIDMPAHGNDTTPAYRVTLGSYVRCVRRAAAAMSRSPLLVGHSMGGMIISRAAADEPGLCAGLIFVSGIIPVEGESVRGLVSLDQRSRLPASVTLDSLGYRVKPEQARGLFYNECSAADAARASARLRPVPLLPLIQRHVERHPVLVPRGCIECTRDHTLTLEHQRAMASRCRFAMRASLVADHSPFLSAPRELAQQLHAMAALDRAPAGHPDAVPARPQPLGEPAL